MNRFALTAKDLQIINLVGNIRSGNHPESVDDIENNDDNPNKVFHQYDGYLTENEYAGRSK